MQGWPTASDDDKPEGEKIMKLDKEKFLKTKFGGELECMITAWDQALGKNRRTGENKEILKTLAWCQAQWEVYRMAIRHFYGVEYHFTRTDEYYGLCTEDESDWLMKAYRELAKDSLYESIQKAISKYGVPDGIYLDQESAPQKEPAPTQSRTGCSKRKFVPQGNPYHALCKKLEREIKRDIITFPAG